MQKIVILANIGNRNIKYFNQGYLNDEIPKKYFLDKTKFLWEHEEELKNITITILPAILEKYPQGSLYLFATLQNPSFEQDTYYEGLIIKKLLKEQYPLLKIEVLVLKDLRANNEEELIPWYRDQINFIRRECGDAFYVMYDTGGTPQQKNSLKSVVEFYFRKNMPNYLQNYLIYQGNDDHNGGTIIEEVLRSASERLSQLTNVKLLIQHNNYAAAKEIALAYDFKHLTNVLDYAMLRWDNMWQEIKRLHQFQNFSTHVKKIEEFDEIKKNDITILNANSEYESVDGISKIGCRDCRNLLSKTENQRSSGNFSGAILSFHQFIETYVAAYIEANSEYKLYSDYRNAGIAMLMHIEKTDYHNCIKIFDKMPYSINFPIQIYFAFLITNVNDESLKFLQKIKNSQSFFKSEVYPQNKKLDSLRNAIAHEGKGVLESEFELYKPFIRIAYKKFIVKSDPFKNINLLIEKMM